MTTKPIRPVESPSSVDGPQPPVMMTIPDFSWQPAAISLAPKPQQTSVPDGPGSLPDCEDEPTAAQTRPDAIRDASVGDQVPVAQTRHVGLGSTRFSQVDSRRFVAGLRKHWMPAGGVAVALLWLGSLLLPNRTPIEAVPQRQETRQARRELPPPLANGRLRKPQRPAPKPSAAPASPQVPESTRVADDSVSQQDPQDQLFGAVPTLGDFPQPDGLMRSDPAPTPRLNPPTGPARGEESDRLPTAMVAPARPASVGPSAPMPAGPAETDPAMTSVSPTAAGRSAGPRPQRETEYEWAAPHSVAAEAPEMRRQDAPANVAVPSRPNRSTASQPVVTRERPVYRQTDPSNYKDPLYEIPPLARQPRGPSRQ